MNIESTCCLINDKAHIMYKERSKLKQKIAFTHWNPYSLYVVTKLHKECEIFVWHTVVQKSILHRITPKSLRGFHPLYIICRAIVYSEHYHW
jgi:hypothetical protein